ncbi:hypothetical protein B296_00031273 [Ensete ventricosum]|uniref:Uncharacterized protein n=1 Tax=Ensete ventricosum TaxID=4639 RepID=A0A427A8P5_ENSVE|nr:hypothetical protein B296_00031273 [Ensete ventricosum]
MGKTHLCPRNGAGTLRWRSEGNRAKWDLRNPGKGSKVKYRDRESKAESLSRSGVATDASKRTIGMCERKAMS